MASSGPMREDNSSQTLTRRVIAGQHIRQLSSLCILLHILTVLLASLASYLHPFDSSADILLDSESSSLLNRWVTTSLRWDAFHFLQIAQRSHQFEYEWAFFPGVPIVLRTTTWILNLVKHLDGLSTHDMLLGHFLLTAAVSCEKTRTLYLLTMQHTQSPTTSLLTGYLSLLSSSPATLHLALYAEPWFALFSYKGMLYCAQRRWFLASIMFALAGMFRSNGLFLGGFLVWGMVVEPLIAHCRIQLHTVLFCLSLSVLQSLPFILHQISGYLAFCANPSSIAPQWCTHHLPLIYTHVQSHYWNSGFLRYWTMQQLPNFLISAPVLVLLIFSSTTYILRVTPSLLSSKVTSKSIPTQPLLTPSFLPHAIHAFIFTCMLLFASHTQIILRLASSMPFTYWSAARLFFEHPKWAKAWVAWSIVWGATSIVLWTTFLPPA